jgi:transposase InsO family protein
MPPGVGSVMFAKRCDVAPQPASSGRTIGRHRLSRSGDRQANSWLYIITIVRMRHHELTRAYAERRTNRGLNKREIIRCLKRYIAREIYANLPPQQTNSTPQPKANSRPLDKHRSIERFHRRLADEWAYARLYTTDSERCQAFTDWLHTYNHHRGHTALGGQPTATRVPNLSGQYG